MKRRSLSFLVITAIVLMAGVYLLLRPHKPPNYVPMWQKVKESLGSLEDPQARARWEWMRLRNPSTGEIPRNIRARELSFAATLPTTESLRAFNKGIGEGEYRIQTQSWNRRGPINVGGRTRALAIDVTNESILLAGGVSGGMWRSTNGGSSWTKTTDPTQLHIVTAIAQDTRSGKTNTWYYGTGEFLGSAGGHAGTFFTGDGIFKSTDGGLTWSQLSSTASGTPHRFDNAFDFIWNIVIDASNTANDEVYVAAFGGIYRSLDGGGTWSRVLGELSNDAPWITDVAITSTGVLYATLSEGSISGVSAATRGIYRSTDGVSWVNITPTGWPSSYNRVVIGIAPSNENVVYFLAETPGSGKNNHSLWKYTYISGDGSGAGGSWENRSSNLPAFGGPVGDFDSQTSYDLMIKVKPDDENVVFIGGTNLYRSTDGFATSGNIAWIGGYSTANDVSIYDNHHPDQHAMVFLPSSSTTMISGHDGGLSKTTDNLATNVSWTYLNNGYFTTQFYTIAIDHGTSGNNVIIGGMQDNGTYFTNSASSTTPWVQIFSGDGAFCAIADGRSSYYVSSQNGKTYRLILNNSGTLTGWTRVDPTGGTGYLFINPFTIDPNDNTIMYLAGGDRLWRNSDLTGIPLFSNNTTTTNWTELTNSVVPGASISAVTASKTPANRVYYGTHNGQVYRLDDANSGDPTPTNIWSGKGFPSGAYVSSIAVDPTNADNVMVVFSNYEIKSIFYSADGGNSWTDVSGNLEQNPDGSGNGPSVRWAAILPVGNSQMYFVATSTGVYSTTSLNGAATTWAQEGATSIGNVIVDMIDTRTSDGLVVVATHGNGVFSTNVTATGIVRVGDAIPRDFTLNQNFPNPFNPTTTIEYSITNETRVELKIYNMRGQEVATLVNARQSPATYRVTWDGTDQKGKTVASGVYLYRLKAGKFTQTKRMMFLK